MILSDIIDISKNRLRNIAKSFDVDYMIKIINIGISDLYNRFNLSIKSEVIATMKDMPMYEVRSPDCQMLVNIYKPDGTELQQSDVLGSKIWQWKQINFRSFLLSNPQNDHVIAIYKAAPIPITKQDSQIELPPSFIEALLLYITYMIAASLQSTSTSTGHRGSNESQTYRQMYEEECSRLIMMGYKINIQTERPPIQLKGFV